MKTTKSNVIVLLVLFIIGVAVVLLVYTAYVLDEKPYGGFTRNIVANMLTDSVVVALPFNSYYIAGEVKNTIYLGNQTAPLHVLSLSEGKLVSMNISVQEPKPRASHIVVDSPFFYLEDLETYTIQAGFLASLKVEFPTLQSRFFSEAVPLSPNSIIQRTISDRAKEYALAKLTSQSNTYRHGLLQKQIDGLFCTDGMLTYDKETQRFIYVYFYRNEFISTDTSLDLQFRQNTIDTISRARINVANLAAEDEIILSSPPFVVNRRSAVLGNRLFINSSIASDFETSDTMKHNSVIDVYDLGNEGEYLYSFYLPHFLGYEMKQFAIRGNRLYSLHERFLVQYQLKQM